MKKHLLKGLSFIFRCNSSATYQRHTSDTLTFNDRLQTFPSELLENIEDIFHRYYMHSGVCNIFNLLITR